jgi:hypothetical protein
MERSMEGSLEPRVGARHIGRTFAILAAFLPLVSGCFLVAAGAGAGGGVYLTTRGVRSVITAPVASVANATERAFTDLGLRRTELRVEGNGEKQELKAKPDSGDPEVTVTLERSGDTSTDVEVTARTSAVTWDKDYARRVLDKIMERSAGN